MGGIKPQDATLHVSGYFGFSKIDTKNLNFYCRLGNGISGKPVQADAAVGCG